jgi:hypothetical protein
LPLIPVKNSSHHCSFASGSEVFHVPAPVFQS